MFNLKWFRLDLLIVLIYFVFANDNQSSFLTHIFGFTAGIVITTVMVVSNIIKSEHKITKIQTEYWQERDMKQETDKGSTYPCLLYLVSISHLLLQ